jgi:hypothetical protein
VTPSAMKCVEPMNRPGLSSNSAPTRPRSGPTGRVRSHQLSQVWRAKFSLHPGHPMRHSTRSTRPCPGKKEKRTHAATTAGLADLIAKRVRWRSFLSIVRGSAPLVRYYHDTLIRRRRTLLKLKNRRSWFLTMGTTTERLRRGSDSVQNVEAEAMRRPASHQ